MCLFGRHDTRLWLPLSSLGFGRSAGMSLGRHGTFAAAVEVPECLLGDMALFAAAVEVLECLLGGMVLFSAVVRPWGRVVCRSASLEAWHSIVAAAKPIGGSVEAPAWIQGGWHDHCGSH